MMCGDAKDSAPAASTLTPERLAVLLNLYATLKDDPISASSQQHLLTSSSQI
jgi:hypothetical protein